jgi:hypothetical protein
MLNKEVEVRLGKLLVIKNLKTKGKKGAMHREEEKGRMGEGEK